VLHTTLQENNNNIYQPWYEPHFSKFNFWVSDTFLCCGEMAE
jgi:hypothetical protein